MRNKFLGAVAAFAFVATGVAARAQEGQHLETHGAAGAPAVAPGGPQRPEAGAMRKEEAPKAAQGERREDNGAMRKDEAPKAAQGERRGLDGEKENARGGASDAMRKDAPRDRSQAAQNRGAPRVNGVRISSEHAVRIDERLRRDARPQRPSFAVRVGTRVPEGFAIRPLPPDIVEYAPDYRGYDYFIDDSDEIVFVSPETHEIVGTIDYEGRASAVDAPRAARPCPPEE